MPFKTAIREQLTLKMLLAGPTDSGKTATGLLMCTELCRHYGGKFAVICSENGRCRHYLGTKWAPDGFEWEDQKIRTPEAYRTTIQEAQKAGFTALLIDGITPAWSSEGGLVDRSQTEGGDWRVWNKLGKVQKKFVDEQTRSSMHVISTCRTKNDWVTTEVDDGKGRTKLVPQIVGIDIDQRKGIEYEFDIFGVMDKYHTISMVKATSCDAISGKIIDRPGIDNFVKPIIEWLDTGTSPSIVNVPMLELATPVQLKRFYEMYKSAGFDETRVTAEFYKKNGKKPEEVSTEYLQEKIEELIENMRS